MDCEGKLIKDSFEYKRSKGITELLEQKYGLIPAQAQKQPELWQLTPVDPAQDNLKKQISAVVKPLASMYKFQSLGEYRALLSLYNIGLEEVKREVRGKPYRGLVYSALDKDWEKVGTPLKSSLFGKWVGYDGLENHMGKSGKEIKEQGLMERTRAVVSGIVNTSRSESELRAKLQSVNIDLVVHRNDQGRIYGITFIDHNDRYVFNGSRLGKEFLANVFNDRFGGVLAAGMDSQTVSCERSDDTQQTIQPGNKLSSHMLVEEMIESAGSLFSVFSPGPAGHTDDNQPMVRKRKKKRRSDGRQDGNSSLVK